MKWYLYINLKIEVQKIFYVIQDEEGLVSRGGKQVLTTPMAELVRNRFLSLSRWLSASWSLSASLMKLTGTGASGTGTLTKGHRVKGNPSRKIKTTFIDSFLGNTSITLGGGGLFDPWISQIIQSRKETSLLKSNQRETKYLRRWRHRGRRKRGRQPKTRFVQLLLLHVSKWLIHLITTK